jgi:predicted nucleic acid-binding protein
VTSVLDTSVAIGAIPPDFNDQVGISIITLAELHYAVMAATDDTIRGARLQRLSALQAHFDPLPVDGAVAAAYGRLAAAVATADSPTRIRPNDLLIAATAVAHGARLVTRNPSALSGLGELVEIVSL